MTLRVFTEPQLGASYEQLRGAAVVAEESGYGAFFRSDHVGRMGPRKGLPTITDAWVTLAGLARDTTSIRLGTLVTPVTFRHPGIFAVTAAQVDHMSGGRLEVGLGAGWYAREHSKFGLPFPDLGTRQDTLEDQLALLSGVWSAPPGTRFERVGATGSWTIDADEIRPEQRPHPPIVLGGRGMPRSARLAVSYADEYNVPFRSAAETKEVHDRIRLACEASGRDPQSLIYSAAQVVFCGRTEAEAAKRAEAAERDFNEVREGGWAGTPAEILEKLDTFVRCGVDRFYLQFLDIADLDHLRLVADEVQVHAPGR